MNELPSSELHRLNAVHGWLELGCPADAAAELQSMDAQCRDHPAVLDASWHVQSSRGLWDEAFQVAERTVQLHPDLAGGWIHRAYAARRRTGGGLAQARDLLRPAADRFPKEAVIPYNLACYAAQLGVLTEATLWLDEAFRRGERKQLLQMALSDEDLRPLWPQLAAGLDIRR